MAKYPVPIQVLSDFRTGKTGRRVKTREANVENSQFDFLCLPQEIRFVFYDHFFQGGVLKVKGLLDIKLKAPGLHIFSLPLACKILYSETRPFLIRGTVLKFARPTLLCNLSFLPLALDRSLSDFTLNNIRYIDSMPLIMDDCSWHDFMFAGHLRPNPNFGRIIAQLPSLRVCVTREIILHDNSPMSTAKNQCKIKGPSHILQQRRGQNLKDFLLDCGVDLTTADSGPQIVVTLKVATDLLSSNILEEEDTMVSHGSPH